MKGYWETVRQAGCRDLQNDTAAPRVARTLADGAATAATVLFEAALAQAPQGAPAVALVGLGGLGRRELAPFSDLDLALLCAVPDHPAVAALADQVFYPLWNAGLTVGHAVRSPAQFAKLAQQDDMVRTSALDVRALGGDAAPPEELRRRLAAALSGRACRRRSLAQCRAWASHGGLGSVFELQPDIKSGPGGLRELHHLWWLTRELFGIASWTALRDDGLASDFDLHLLQEARATLLQIRLAMHYVSGRRQDQLRFELQDEVAAFLGIRSGEGGRLPGDNLLHMFYVTAAGMRGAAGRILENAVERLAPQRSWRRRPVAGLALQHGRLALPHRDPQAVDLADVLRVLRAAQVHGLALHAQTRGCLVAAAARLCADDRPLSPALAAQACALLAEPRDRGAALTTLFDLELLPALLPQFAQVRGLTQRDLYHVHTVDAHLVCCARAALCLLSGHGPPEAPDAPHLGRILDVAARLVQPQLLVLAALLHDVGKGQGRDHSEVGAAMASDAAQRLHLAAAAAGDLQWLVAHHLDMFRISQRRDLDDPELLQQFAAAVGSTARLDLLLALSFVDALTTGPQAWNAWKGDLLLRLFDRTRQRLQHGAPDAARRDAAKQAQLLAGHPAQAAALGAFLDSLPARHLALHEAARLQQHFELLQQARAQGVAVQLLPQGNKEPFVLLLAARDRLGLLGGITGALAAYAVSIDAAHICCTTDGWAIDTLVLRDRPILHGGAKWAQLLAELLATLAGDEGFAARLAERQRAQRTATRRGPQQPARILFEAQPQGGASVVDVYAPDRVGLLHAISHALAAAEVAVVLARINTEGQRAIDSFYLVEGRTGEPLSAARQGAVAALLRGVVGA